MRRIIVREARPGMRVARTVLHPGGTDTLLEQGMDLGAKQIAMLHEQGVYDIWIEDTELAFLDEVQASSLSTPQSRLLDALCRSLQQFTGVVSRMNAQRPLLKKHKLALGELIPQLLRAVAGVPCFSAMATQHEELLQHASDVCITTTLLGLEMEEYIISQRPRVRDRQSRDVLNLALGALLHDVGEIFMPLPQRESRSEGLEPEGEDWKQHTAQGFSAVRKFVDPSAAAVVLHHHQRFDGTGFAIADAREMKQCSEGIHIFARLTAVADVLQHLLCPLGNGGAVRSMVQALWQIQQIPLRTGLDPMVLSGVLTMLPPFVPGMVVALSDRRQAVVTRVNPDWPCYPEVQVLRGAEEAGAAPWGAGEVIDLAAEAKLEIEGVGVSRVAKYLYGPRKGRPIAA